MAQPLAASSDKPRERHVLDSPMADSPLTSATNQAASRRFNFRQVSREEPVRSVGFPLLAFERALKQLDFDSLANILRPCGWSQLELGVLEDRMKVKKRDLELWMQATKEMPFESKSINALDEVTSQLLSQAIEKGFLPLIPAVPAFSGVSADFYCDECAKVATRYLCEEFTEDRFQMFLAVFKKHKPKNSGEYVVEVLKTAARRGDEAMIQKLRKFFPKELEPVVNQMFKPDVLCRIIL